MRRPGPATSHIRNAVTTARRAIGDATEGVKRGVVSAARPRETGAYPVRATDGTGQVAQRQRAAAAKTINKRTMTVMCNERQTLNAGRRPCEMGRGSRASPPAT